MPTLKINGISHTLDLEPETPLLWVIRATVGLTGTKYGYGIQQCGACTVLVGRRPVRSCGMTVGEAAGKDVTTIEGLSEDSTHPVQLAWVEQQVPQCGYCQSGQIMAAVSRLERSPDPSDKEIDRGMLNLCRCGTYPRVRKAIRRAAELQKEAA